ncbi:MAG: serine protease [Elusimicrobiota bacterium]|jgi:ATP-dependent protease ClpP protease subunit|nr:serine protease [Elusimicrobiota bacterium]
MPIAQDILLEIKGCNQPLNTAVDCVRRKYLKSLSDQIKKPVIIYAANFNKITSGISREDIHSFMSMCYGINKEKKEVCIVLHTPGGETNAIESIVKYIRTQFDNIDVIVPMFAYSAGTMWCCACNRIYMGKNSFLGPIDPQMPFVNNNGQIDFYPAQAIIDQFETAKKECAENRNNAFAWQFILQQYAPSKITECKNAVNRSIILVKEWLTKYQNIPPKKAADIAKWLGQHNKHKDHGRPLCIEELNKKGFSIIPLEKNQQLQDATLSLYHAIDYTFQIAPSTSKIIENTAGVYIIK